MKFKLIFLTAAILLILSNIIMNIGDIAAIYEGPEKYPVFQQVDFSDYYTASRMLAENKGGIYDSQAFMSYAAKIGKTNIYSHSINYPAIHYTLLIPFSLMDYNSALKAWLIMNHIFILLSCFLISFTFLKKSNIKVKTGAFLILFAYSLFSASSIDNMGHGQVNAELLFLISLCIYLYTVLQDNKWQFLSGIPLGLSIAVKGLPAPVALYFLWKKDWKSLTAVIVSFVFFTVLPGIIFGLDLLTGYTSVKSRYLFFTEGVADTSSYGFWKFIVPYSQEIPQILYAITFVIIVGVSLWLISGKNGGMSPAFNMAFLVTLIPLISPFSWSYHHVMNLIPITAVFCALWNVENPDKKTYALLAGIVTISFILGTSDAAFMPFYLYAETVRNHRILPGLFGMPYIYIKAFFRDYRLLFVSNLALWGITGLLLKSNVSRTAAGSMNGPLPESGNSKQDIFKE